MNDYGKILFDRLSEVKMTNDGKIDLNQIDIIIKGFMDSIKGYINNQNDISIYNEIAKIADQIQKVKSEVVNLNPGSIGVTFSELHEVTKSTEDSTNIILDAAEIIQNVALKMTDKESAIIIIEKVTAIFEACNFQDVTGQRINKSLKLLEDVDTTITGLIKSFSSRPSINTAKLKATTSAPLDSELTNGPQINAPSQSQIDDLFNK